MFGTEEKRMGKQLDNGRMRTDGMSNDDETRQPKIPTRGSL